MAARTPAGVLAVVVATAAIGATVWWLRDRNGFNYNASRLKKKLTSFTDRQAPDERRQRRRRQGSFDDLFVSETAQGESLLRSVDPIEPKRELEKETTREEGPSPRRRPAGENNSCGCDGGCECGDARDTSLHDVEETPDVGIDFGASTFDRIASLRAADDSLDNIDDTQFPEQTRVFVKTFGCSHNVSDSEFMMGMLKAAGYQLVQKWEDCNVAVLNSCTVKNPSQEGAVNLAAKIIQGGKKVVIAGCVVQADTKIPQFKNVSAIGVKQIDKIVEAVSETLKGNVYFDISSRRDLPSLALPKVRRNNLIEIIPLSTGCLGSCTYCKTKQARGHLGSYAPEAIVERVRSAVLEGVQQIWLTSEDTGAYGLDIKANIVELLNLIKETIEQTPSKHRVMIRLGMTNPPYIMSNLKALAKILESEHFFEFLHIPVQSGSNKVLLEMNREYTCEDFEKCINELRSSIPNIHLSTDFICGFPDETNEDHQESMNLLEKYKFPTLNISQFYPRPGTPAAIRKRVPTQIVKARSQGMTKSFLSYRTLEPWIGQRALVWFSEISDKSHHTVGHTKQYIKVLVDRDNSLIGTQRLCEFTGCSKWHLLASLILTE